MIHLCPVVHASHAVRSEDGRGHGDRRHPLSDVGRMVAKMIEFDSDLPSHLYPAALLVFVEILDPGGTPKVMGGYALATQQYGVRQRPLVHLDHATTYSQGVVLALIRALQSFPPRVTIPFKVYLPDPVVVALLTGSTTANTPVLARMIDEARHLLQAKAPNAQVLKGHFQRLVSDDLLDGRNLWD